MWMSNWKKNTVLALIKVGFGSGQETKVAFMFFCTEMANILLETRKVIWFIISWENLYNLFAITPPEVLF